MPNQNENQKHWENFAEKNAKYYIDTSLKNPDQFWRKGKDNFNTYILPILEKYQVTGETALDFGCGIGRYTFPLCSYFHKVIGVDISNNMLEKARQYAKERNIQKTQFIQNENFFDLPDESPSIDFIYSVNVFQHIEDPDEIQRILHKMAKILRGYAYIQFDTRPKNWKYKIKSNLPDFILPKAQKSGIRRTRIDFKILKEIFQKCGLKIIQEQQPISESNFFILKYEKTHS